MSNIGRKYLERISEFPDFAGHCFWGQDVLSPIQKGIMMTPPTEFRKNFAHRLRKLRKATGDSQLVFALKHDLNRSYYSGLETGTRNASLDMLPRLADAFGLTIAELFEGVPHH